MAITFAGYASYRNELLRHTGVDPDARVKDVAEPESNRLQSYISRNYVVEGDLCCEVSQIIQRLIDINHYATVCRYADSAPRRTHGPARDRARQSLVGDGDAARERSKGDGNEIRKPEGSAGNHDARVA